MYVCDQLKLAYMTTQTLPNMQCAYLQYTMNTENCTAN